MRDVFLMIEPIYQCSYFLKTQDGGSMSFWEITHWPNSFLIILILTVFYQFHWLTFFSGNQMVDTLIILGIGRIFFTNIGYFPSKAAILKTRLFSYRFDVLQKPNSVDLTVTNVHIISCRLMATKFLVNWLNWKLRYLPKYSLLVICRKLDNIKSHEL